MPPHHPHRVNPEAGWTLIEVLVVVLIIGVMAAMAVLATPLALTLARADSGSSQLVALLHTAREQAISQRRNVIVQFNAPNQVVVSRVEQPGPGTTVLATAFLENGVRFLLFNGIGDTPDGFGNASATEFGGAVTVAFTSEGTFVDDNGDEVNGSVFLGVPNQPQTARAVTIFGPTALVREWKWQGNHWGE